MHVRFRSTSLLIAAALLAGSALTASAQDNMFSVEIGETHVQTFPAFGSATTDIMINVMNLTSSNLELYVNRDQNEFPGEGWTSQVCLGEKCYSPEESSYPPIAIQPGQPPYCKITVVSPLDGTGEAHIKLSFKVGMLGTPVIKEFTITPPSISAVDVPSIKSRIVSAYPNPASGTATIPLPENVSYTGAMTLRLFDAQGVMVSDLTDAARTSVASGATGISVDVNGLAAGAYFYRLDLNNEKIAGSLVVVH